MTVPEDHTVILTVTEAADWANVHHDQLAGRALRRLREALPPAGHWAYRLVQGRPGRVIVEAWPADDRRRLIEVDGDGVAEAADRCREALEGKS